jgi:hypothetical protein
MRSGIAHFIHKGHMTHVELADSFVLLADRIIRFRKRHAPPFIAYLYRPVQKTVYQRKPGEIRMGLTHAEWSAGPLRRR